MLTVFFLLTFPQTFPLWQVSVLCLDPIVRRRSSLFGHVARLPEDAPVHQALRCHIDLSLGHLPDPSWRRCPGRPQNRWLDQLYRDSGTPPSSHWRRAITRGHLRWSYVLYGPLRLHVCVSDDDDDDYADTTPLCILYASLLFPQMILWPTMMVDSGLAFFYI